jgi:hypothetical protein
MVGVKHQLDPATPVGAVQLRVAVIMTNQGTALNPFDGKDAQVIPGRVMGEATCLFHSVAPAKPFVIAVDELASIADDA